MPRNPSDPSPGMRLRAARQTMPRPPERLLPTPPPPRPDASAHGDPEFNRLPGAIPAERGILMDTSVMFVDCPAYMDDHGAVRCGLPAEVVRRYLAGSSNGPLESAKIRCPAGHWFNGPVGFLTLDTAVSHAQAKPAMRPSSPPMTST